MMIPEVGFLRLKQIVGSKKEGIAPIVPVSRSAWWNGIKAGRYPKGIKLSERTTVWKVKDILALIDKN
jgi:prophage regulatory protein